LLNPQKNCNDNKKQPIISWLLNDNYVVDEKLLGVPGVKNIEHFGYLHNGLLHLSEVRNTKPNWGLPELIMPSFEKVMTKSAKAFYNIDHQLFQEFYEDNVCGILLSKDCGTIVYGFGDNRLYVWVFGQRNNSSQIHLYFYVESTPDNIRKIFTHPTLVDNEELFSQELENREEIYSTLANKLIIYLAVKKYVEVETIVVPYNGILKISDIIPDYKQKDKVQNISGQEVIVMDSRWFRKIINNNEIFVRGFFRFQNKKNEKGEWYKELIFVDSYVRHGYHRNALIEEKKISSVSLLMMLYDKRRIRKVIAIRLLEGILLLSYQREEFYL